MYYFLIIFILTGLLIFTATRIETFEEDSSSSSLTVSDSCSDYLNDGLDCGIDKNLTITGDLTVQNITASNDLTVGGSLSANELSVNPGDLSVTGKINATDNLCIGDTCLTEDHLKLLTGANDFKLRKGSSSEYLVNDQRPLYNDKMNIFQGGNHQRVRITM
jgi:hypothetical protein